jgi:hypothetical protein
MYCKLPTLPTCRSSPCKDRPAITTIPIISVSVRASAVLCLHYCPLRSTSTALLLLRPWIRGSRCCLSVALSACTVSIGSRRQRRRCMARSRCRARLTPPLVVSHSRLAPTRTAGSKSFSFSAQPPTLSVLHRREPLHNLQYCTKALPHRSPDRESTLPIRVQPVRQSRGSGSCQPARGCPTFGSCAAQRIAHGAVAIF